MNFAFTTVCENFYGLPVVNAFVGAHVPNISSEENIERLLKTNPVRCCFDTGANNTAIGKHLLSAMNVLEAHGRSIIFSPNAVKKSEQYKIDILLPGDVLIIDHTVNVVESVVDLFIGMDIIRVGDFALTNNGGKQILSFGIPH